MQSRSISWLCNLDLSADYADHFTERTLSLVISEPIRTKCFKIQICLFRTHFSPRCFWNCTGCTSASKTLILNNPDNVFKKTYFFRKFEIFFRLYWNVMKYFRYCNGSFISCLMHDCHYLDFWKKSNKLCNFD